MKKGRIKKFLRYIFAPRIIVHQHGNMTQAEMNKANKVFEKGDELFKEAEKLFNEYDQK